MQGVGNDFVVAGATQIPEETDLNALAVSLCHRQFGVGGDGLLLVSKPYDADLEMRIFNADGTEDTMCGNGLRCVVRYAFMRGIVGETGVAKTRAGNIPFVANRSGSVTLDLGLPRFDSRQIFGEQSRDDPK